MDVASLTLKVTTDGMEQAQAKTEGLTKSAAVLEAQTTKLTASTTRLGPASRMTGEEIDALKASYERLHDRQDAFLQSLDKQAATMGKGAAAMRAYKAEQLGLTDDKVFQRLNAQISEAETGSSGMARMLENMVTRMGLHMILFVAAIKGVSFAFDEIVNGAEKWREVVDKINEKDSKASLSLGNLVRSLREENEAYRTGANTVGGLNGHLERQSVLKAEMMAMGPEYRSLLSGENSDLKIQVTLLRQANDERLKTLNAQIAQREADKPTSSSNWKTLFGTVNSQFFMGGIFSSPAARSDLEALDKYNDQLNKLYQARADLMKANAELDGAFDRQQQVKQVGYEINHQIYKLDEAEKGGMHTLSPEKILPANLLEPASEKVSFSFKKVEDYATTMMRKMRDAAESGDAFAAMGYEVARSSGAATDAMARWMDNTDGLGRSWTTLGNTVRNVLADMIRQMERAIIQQQLMDPLLKWAGVAISGFAAGGSGLSTSGVAPSGWTGMTTAAPPQGGAGPQASIVVNVNSDGTAKATSQDASKAGTDLAQMMEPVMNAWAIKQSRSGGLLAARA